jgi:hypothetical protein
VGAGLGSLAVVGAGLEGADADGAAPDVLGAGDSGTDEHAAPQPIATASRATDDTVIIRFLMRSLSLRTPGRAGRRRGWQTRLENRCTAVSSVLQAMHPRLEHVNETGGRPVGGVRGLGRPILAPMQQAKRLLHGSATA